MIPIIKWLPTSGEPALPTYPTLTTDPARRMMDHLRIFGMSGGSEQVGRTSRVRVSPEGWLEIFHNSPSFRWRRTADTWRPKAANCGVSREQAQVVADSFLKTHGVWRDPRQTRVDDTTVQTDGGRPPFTPERIVTYSFKIGDHELYGPGARTVVTIGHDGSVSEMHRFDREPAPSVLPPRPTLRSRAQDEFVKWFQDQKEPTGPMEIAVEARLVYLAAPPRQSQPFLVPFYIFRWKPMVEIHRAAPSVRFRATPAVSVEGTPLAPFNFASNDDSSSQH
jgi:hypothetical protein